MYQKYFCLGNFEHTTLYSTEQQQAGWGQPVSCQLRAHRQLVKHPVPYYSGPDTGNQSESWHNSSPFWWVEGLHVGKNEWRMHYSDHVLCRPIPGILDWSIASNLEQRKSSYSPQRCLRGLEAPLLQKLHSKILNNTRLSLRSSTIEECSFHAPTFERQDWFSEKVTENSPWVVSQFHFKYNTEGYYTRCFVVRPH